MSQADIVYEKLFNKIEKEGIWDNDRPVRPKWADGTPAHTKAIIGHTIRFDNTEVPLLTKKKVFAKTAILEAPFWMWQMKSNKLQDLRDLNGTYKTVWNEWEIKEGKWAGTIGPAYGYILGLNTRRFHKDYVDPSHLDPKKEHPRDGDYYILDQVDATIQTLLFNPDSRRNMTNTWIPEYLDEMALTPCVYETQQHVKQRRYTMEVKARSNDIGLGNSFNIIQYNVLQRMLAQVTNLELGEFIFHMGDAHVYDRHFDALREQMALPSFEAPEIWINPDVKNFYDFTIDDIKFPGYKDNCGPYINMEVAI